MGQDKYTKFVLTVIAFSLFWIALNLSVIEFVLYNFYNGEMEKILLEISSQTTEISSRINEFYSRVSEISSRIEEISSRADDFIDAIKKR
jgi:methyl-accepting chemotaxis protein|tara:strand:- start:320 stop:589 length:270 start_codon:yes stop_codon:yes gene_type:complete